MEFNKGFMSDSHMVWSSPLPGKHRDSEYSAASHQGGSLSSLPDLDMSYFMRPSVTPSMPQNSVKKSNSTAGEARLLALEHKKNNGMFAIAHYAHPVAGWTSAHKIV